MRFIKNNNKIDYDVNNSTNEAEENNFEAELNNVEAEQNTVEAEQNTVEAEQNTVESEQNIFEAELNNLEVELNTVEVSKSKKIFKNNKFITAIRPAIMCLIIFVFICGIIYPISVTIMAQVMFPYESNGSQITVTLADGTQKVFGSELIGQSYENPKYLFGRVNTGAPSNLSPESEEFKELIQKRIDERKEKLAAIGYTDETLIPDELLTSSGSGVDPHISPETAYIQIPIIVYARQKEGNDISESDVRAIIDKYTEGRFLGIFGEKRVNVLLVNLALDGLI